MSTTRTVKVTDGELEAVDMAIDALRELAELCAKTSGPPEGTARLSEHTVAIVPGIAAVAAVGWLFRRWMGGETRRVLWRMR